VRADAQRNRQRLIEVTVELILEVGGEPARDAVAERAGVGIGTLYRTSRKVRPLRGMSPCCEDDRFSVGRIIKLCRPATIV
jgi:hypothetical protein